MESGDEAHLGHAAGPFYPQKRIEIRPNPRGSFKGRIYQVAMSPESVLQCAKAGARMVIFAQKPWEAQAEAVKEYKAAYKAQHGEDAQSGSVRC